MDESHVFSRDGLGNYHRLLKAGTYDIHFSADGYFPKTYTGIVVTDYDSTFLLAELVSASLISDFSADQTLVSVGSTVHFTQQCFGEPDTYQWTFEGGDPATSNEENPVVTYNEAGAFDVTLVITKGADSQEMHKEGYIRVNEEYIMDNQTVTTCSGLFLDDGGTDNNYADSKDYTMTFISDDASANSVLTVDFVEFSLESNTNCTYDYLEVYNGPNTSSPLVGKYCGTSSPGLVISDNDEKALTFKFHSDGNTNFSGWKAAINCTIVDAVDELTLQHIKVYPNPANEPSIVIESVNEMEEVIITNLRGQIISKVLVSGKKETIDISSLTNGVYIFTVITQQGLSHQKVEVR